jgi:hypothetical protein
MENCKILVRITGINNMENRGVTFFWHHTTWKICQTLALSYHIFCRLKAAEMLIQMRCVILRFSVGDHQGYQSCPVTLELLKM